MRILHVVHQYVPDHVAGTELYTQMIARRQVESGHEVAVFAPLNRAESDREPAVEGGVRVYRAAAGARSPTAVFRSTFGHAGLAVAFADAVRREQPEIVHLQHLMGIPAAVIDSLAGIPYIISLHDYWYGCANGQLLTNDTEALCAGPDARHHNCGRCAVARAGLSGAAGLLGPVAAPVLRRRCRLLRPIFAGAARVLAPNAFVRQMYAAMGFSTEAVVINPLGLEAPPIAPPTRPATRGQGLRLGYVGSISRQKGLHVLIDAVNGMPAKSVTLDIYGDLAVFPGYAAELRAKARHPGIRFNGVVGRDRVWAALAALDALVFPTLWYEASPAIIREAFAVRTPIVASNLGAAAAMIRHGVDGLLFQPGDADALRAILLELLEQPGRVGALRAGIAPVETVADHVTRIERVYHEVLATDRQAPP